MTAERRLRIFLAYRDAPERRVALAAPQGSPERYRLFGLDELAARADVQHNLGAPVPTWARFADRVLNRVVYGSGGYGGDFASVLASLRAINSADVVLSTVDTVGIPIVLLQRFGVVRTPVVYVAIGLPERLAQLRRLHGLRGADAGDHARARAPARGLAAARGSRRPPARLPGLEGGHGLERPTAAARRG